MNKKRKHQIPCKHANSSYMVVSSILNSFFTIVKQRTTYWNLIIPSICELAMTVGKKYEPSQATGLKFTLRGILMFLVKMPQTVEYRNPIVQSLKSVDIKEEIIQQTTKLVDVRTQSTQTLSQKVLPKKRSQLEDAKPSKKFKQMNENLFPTPYGDKTPEELSELVVEALKNTSVQYPKQPMNQLNFESFVSIIMQMMKNQDEENRFYIQNYISQIERVVVDRTRDPRLQHMSEQSKLTSEDPQNEEEMKKLIESFKSKVSILTSDQKYDLLKDVRNYFQLTIFPRDGI
jgi:hypothetical protein